MRKLLFIGDAACDSGFARGTHAYLNGVDYRLGGTWDCQVLGINYRGSPHDYPYHIWPAWAGGDLLGTKYLLHVLSKFPADMIVIQNDPWNIPAYITRIDQLKQRPALVGVIAVDGKNCMGKALNGLDHVVFWTKFAQDEARLGGFVKTSSVIPLGVDTQVFRPKGRGARTEMGLPEEYLDKYWVINVNRNQPRKRLDLTIQYFAEWVKDYNVPDAMLFLHVCPTGDFGIDCDGLAGYYGLKGRIILNEPDPYRGASDAAMASLYSAGDCGMSTTMGEGWGLPALEGMACGLPWVLPKWSAYEDWAAEAALLVPCSNRISMWGGPNVIGGVPDKDAMITSLDRLYRDPFLRASITSAGFTLADRPEYRWANIGTRFAEEVERTWRAVQVCRAETPCERGSQDSGVMFPTK